MIVFVQQRKGFLILQQEIAAMSEVGLFIKWFNSETDIEMHLNLAPQYIILMSFANSVSVLLC